MPIDQFESGLQAVITVRPPSDDMQKAVQFGRRKEQHAVANLKFVQSRFGSAGMVEASFLAIRGPDL